MDNRQFVITANSLKHMKVRTGLRNALDTIREAIGDLEPDSKHLATKLLEGDFSKFRSGGSFQYVNFLGVNGGYASLYLTQD